MNGRLLLTAAGAALLLITIPWSMQRAQRPDTAALPNSSSPAVQLPARPPHSGDAPLRFTEADAVRLLPFGLNQIAQAAQLGCSFTAAYSTHRYDEDPADYLRRLAPMMNPQLRPSIERAATDPSTLAHRRRTRQITIAQAHPDAIRAIGPTSITFVVTATEQITTAYAPRHDTTRYALTLTRADGRWQVYAIELATTGDTGEPIGTGEGGDTS